MSTPQSPNTPITKDQANEIALQDARKVYRDLSVYKIDTVLEGENWHVDFHLKNPAAQGGGPSYIIESKTAKIISKKYYQ